MRTRICGLGAAVVATALLLTGCGGDGASSPGHQTSPPPTTVASTRPPDNGISAKSADEILASAQRAFRSARSVQVKLSFKDKDGLIRMNLKLTRGRDAAGWIEQAGVRVDLVVVGGKVYLRSRKLWEQQGNAELAKLIGDRWVLIPSSVVGELTPFSGDLTIRGLADSVFDPKQTPKFISRSQATIGGVPAVRLQALDGSFYIAATGKPYPLRLDGVGDNQDVEFSSYDQNPSISAPRGALDLKSLQG